MKTDQFDDEIRRKLLGLPAETDAGDAERIFGYVQAHRPGGFGGPGWGKRLLFGTGAALLVGSLLFNLNQYHTTKNLYVSLDSLRHQITRLDTETRQVTTAQTRRNFARCPARYGLYYPLPQPNRYAAASGKAARQRIARQRARPACTGPERHSYGTRSASHHSHRWSAWCTDYSPRWCGVKPTYSYLFQQRNDRNAG